MKYRDRLYEEFLDKINDINDIKDSKINGQSSGLNELLDDLNSIDEIGTKSLEKATEAKNAAATAVGTSSPPPPPTHTKVYNENLARELAYEFLARRITKGNISFEKDSAALALAPATAPATAPTFETQDVQYVEVKWLKDDTNKIEVSIGNGTSEQLQYVNVGLKHDITMQIQTTKINENEGVKVKYYDEKNIQLTGEELKQEGIRDEVDVVVIGENETRVYQIREEKESITTYTTLAGVVKNVPVNNMDNPPKGPSPPPDPSPAIPKELGFVMSQVVRIEERLKMDSQGK